jgi:hypothetical protein
LILNDQRGVACGGGPSTKVKEHEEKRSLERLVDMESPEKKI